MADETVRKQMGEWRLERCLGHSHCSEVYLATHRSESDGTTQSYVVKVATPHASKWSRLMLRQERRVLSKLAHPNIVSLLGSGNERGVDFLVLPYLDGVLAPGGSQPQIAPDQYSRLAWITRQMVSGLRAIHEKGWCHGDLKPDHLSIDRHFHVTLLDFGMSLPLFQRTSDTFSDWIESEAGDEAKRSEIPLWGSPVYMSPEAFLKNALIEPARDIYALGCILYLWITGQRPFYAKSLSGWKKSHLSQRPKHPRVWVPELPDQIARILMSMLAKQPSRRPGLSEIEEAFGRLEVESFGKWLPADTVRRVA